MKRSMSQYEELHYNINVRCVGGWPSPTLYMSCYGEIKWASTRKLKKKEKKKRTSGSGEDFLRFLPYLGMVAILVI